MKLYEKRFLSLHHQIELANSLLFSTSLFSLSASGNNGPEYIPKKTKLLIVHFQASDRMPGYPEYSVLPLS